MLTVYALHSSRGVAWERVSAEFPSDHDDVTETDGEIVQVTVVLSIASLNRTKIGAVWGLPANVGLLRMMYGFAAGTLKSTVTESSVAVFRSFVVKSWPRTRRYRMLSCAGQIAVPEVV